MNQEPETMKEINGPLINPVPETDLNCALDAIHNMRKNRTTGEEHQQLSDEETILLNEAMDKACESFSNRLNDIVKPVPIKEYCDLMRYSLSGEDDESSSDERGPTNDNDDCSSSSESSFEDEEKFIDNEALARVKSLRQEVRNVAQRVSELRTSVTKRTADLTLREIDILRRREGAVSPTARKLFEDHPCQGNSKLHESTKVPSALSSSTVTMQESFHKLSQTLLTVENALPEKITGLRETIETIEASLDKHHMIQQGEMAGVSATEKALFSKVNDGRISSMGNKVKDENIRSENDGPCSPRSRSVSPETRFAQIML